MKTIIQQLALVQGAVYLNGRDMAQLTEREISQRPVGEAAFQRAAELMKHCARVMCPVKEFGPMNERNRLLWDIALTAFSSDKLDRKI